MSVARASIQKLSKLPPMPSIGDILRMYRIRSWRHLSQNFLLDVRYCQKLVQSAGKMHDAYVCEVGPGPGNLTRHILQSGAAKVIAVEKDRRFLPTLKHLAECSGGRMRIIHGDILRYDMESTFPDSTNTAWDSSDLPALHIIGNLPFSVSTPLIIKWLNMISTKRGAFHHGRVRMTLCFQKEVAQRIVAPMDHDQRCRLSIMCQNWCHIKYKMSISGNRFTPPPEVDAGVVHFIPRVKPIIPLPFDLVEKVLAHLFHLRRKKFVRGVEILFPDDVRQEYTERVLQDCELDEARIPVTLSVREIGRICQVYSNICEEDPRVWPFNFREQNTHSQKDHGADGR